MHFSLSNCNNLFFFKLPECKLNLQQVVFQAYNLLYGHPNRLKHISKAEVKTLDYHKVFLEFSSHIKMILSHLRK